jgi:hypothetical protein
MEITIHICEKKTKQHEKGSMRADILQDANRYWSTVDIKSEKAMIRIGGVTIISKIKCGGIKGPSDR